MASLLWWGAQQITREIFSTAAKNPAETSLAFVLVANPATRGFALDVMKSMMWRSTQMTGRIALDVGRAAAARSTTAARIGSYGRTAGQFIKRHPIGTVAAINLAASATAIALAQDEDPATESTRVRSTGFSFGGLGSWGIGTGGSGLVG